MFFTASRQFASVTPKRSSITSDRRNPGVSAIAATFLRRSSRAIANASRITVVFTIRKSVPAVYVGIAVPTSTIKPLVPLAFAVSIISGAANLLVMICV